MLKKIGLLGKNISYSFSKEYFKKKFEKLKINDFSYHVFDFNNLDAIDQLFKIKNLVGFNVTIPYKKEIIPHLDSLSKEAKIIGAVNCVHLIKNKKIGYNTDAIAFQKSLIPLLQKHHKNAIVIGNGGASKAICYALKKLEIEYIILSRKTKFTFKNLQKKHFEEYFLWIQTTPVGTFPNIDHILKIPMNFFNSRHLVYDIIYNPIKTRFLKEAEKYGATIKNGIEMLHIQADASWEIWNNNSQ